MCANCLVRTNCAEYAVTGCDAKTLLFLAASKFRRDIVEADGAKIFSLAQIHEAELRRRKCAWHFPACSGTPAPDRRPIG